MPYISIHESVYFFTSERLGFRQWHDSDFSLAVELFRDAEVTQYVGGPFTEQQIKERLLKEVAAMELLGVQYWPVFLHDSNTFIGCCGLRPYDIDKRIFELGFYIKKAYWGKGYASEAAKRVMTLAFNNLRAGALFAGHNPSNTRSRRLLEKLGFSYSHDEHHEPTGLKHPSYFLTYEAYIRSVSR